MSHWFRDREAEDRAIRAEAEAAALRLSLDKALNQITELTRLVVDMRREGFERPPAPPPPPKDPLTEDIRRAIAERSDPGSRDRRNLETWALGQLERGEDAEKVATEILVGEEAE
jgi:hypothetical protein